MSFLGRLFGARGANDEPAAHDGDPVRCAEVLAVLQELRPMLIADGGDVRLVAVSADGVVELDLVGACARCSVRTMTIEGAIEPRLRARLAWVRGVRG